MLPEYIQKLNCSRFDKQHEVALLIACAGAPTNAATSAYSCSIGSNLNWSFVIEQASAHGLMPRLYWYLHHNKTEACPQPYRDLLRNDFHGNLQHNLHLTGELLKLLQKFAAFNLRILPYKGPVLGALLHSSVAFRESSDLDLLIHTEDFRSVRDLLVSQDYLPDFRASDIQEAAHLQFARDRTFVRRDRKVVVEVHWGVVPRRFGFKLNFDGLWARSVPVNLAGTIVKTLSAEDLVLVLSVHGLKHLWERLGWVCDLAELIRVCPAMDWDRVITRARCLGGERLLYLALRLAKDLLDAHLPEEIARRAANDRAVKVLVNQVCRRLFEGQNRHVRVLETNLFHVRARERGRDRLTFLRRLAFTINENDCAALGKLRPSFLLRFPARVARLVQKYAG